MVSVASQRSGAVGAAVVVMVSALAACAGRQPLLTTTQRADGAERAMNVTAAESRMDVLQFDNQATTYVDVYLVAGQIQWKLGRISPGMRVGLRIPESAIDRTAGFVQLAVIPGSAPSAQVLRDPRAVVAIAQPVSELLSQRWTFRQAAGAPLQLQGARLTRRY